MAQSDDEKALSHQREEFLTHLIRGATVKGKNLSRLPGLFFYRYESPQPPEKYLQEPGICLIAQGTKRLLLNKDILQNDPDHYLLTVLDLPVITEIVEASPEKPYLALALNIDFRITSLLIMDNSLPPVENRPSQRAMTITNADVRLLKAFNRFLELLDEPENIPMLAPLATREILYRLLMSEQGPFLRRMALSGSQNNQIGRAIGWLKKNYDKPLRVEELASFSQMSTSSFHFHFRELTAMSPLQYQKWLRLQEARRLMLTEQLDAANAAFRVGYESPSQFSREYARMFSAPPSRDMKSLRRTLQTS